MTARQMHRLLKFWVSEAGLDAKKYGIESLRRTKAVHILNGTGDLETVRVLFGTATYYPRTLDRRTDPLSVPSSL
jgi:site-specific recombinase XerD